MELTGAEIIVESLQQQGVRWVAGMPGGAVLPLYDALARSTLRHVLVRHEQAAGFIAQGMARVSGRPGVCLATSGPGATNLLTAVADAQRDSVPLVAITGQVPSALIGTDAFQELDVGAMCQGLVKRFWQPRTPQELSARLAQAVRIAQGGRPGVVWIDVPKDVQLARCQATVPKPNPPAPVPCPSASEIEALCERLCAAERPVVMVGGGLNRAEGQAALLGLLQRQPMPVAATLFGLGLLAPEHPLSLGMLGMHGAVHTNLALREADLLLALGVRFDDRATGKLSEFCPQASVIHVDIDPDELGRLKRADLALEGDAAQVLWSAVAALPQRKRPGWLAQVQALERAHPQTTASRCQAPEAARLMDWLSACWPREQVVTTDVGQHQMWVAQHLSFDRPRSLLTSGGLGSMGFGLPAAIGAALQTGKPVLCVTGDGSLLLNCQELATLAELQLPVKVLVLDNRHLGLVRQQQSLFYEGRISAARFERATDFVPLAQAFGLAAERLHPEPAARARLEELLSCPGPGLIHVPIGAAEQVLPMVPPGAPNHTMLTGGQGQTQGR